jgi:hypothetical protein
MYVCEVKRWSGCEKQHPTTPDFAFLSLSTPITTWPSLIIVGIGMRSSWPTPDSTLTQPREKSANVIFSLSTSAVYPPTCTWVYDHEALDNFAKAK